MRCPRDQSELTVRTAEGHVGFVCSTCSGAWLPSKYVQSIEHVWEFSYADFTESVARNVVGPGKLRCPAHCGLLEEVHLSGGIFSWCRRCQGIWFDQGEIARLLSDFKQRESGFGKLVAEQTLWSLLVGILGGLFP